MISIIFQTEFHWIIFFQQKMRLTQIKLNKSWIFPITTLVYCPTATGSWSYNMRLNWRGGNTVCTLPWEGGAVYIYLLCKTSLLHTVYSVHTAHTGYTVYTLHTVYTGPCDSPSSGIPSSSRWWLATSHNSSNFSWALSVTLRNHSPFCVNTMIHEHRQWLQHNYRWVVKPKNMGVAKYTNSASWF